MSDMVNQIVIRPTSNENVKEFSFTNDGDPVIVSKYHYAEFYHPMHGTDADAEFDILGKNTKGRQIAKKLMSKPFEKTIARTTWRPTSLRVYKSPAVDWTSVELDIVAPALKEAFGEKLEFIQHGSIAARELALA